jgi:competence protein ComGC
MKKNKGFTLVEIIVTFCLISTISFLLFQIILSLKNLYTSYDYKTVLLVDQGNLTRKINDDFFDMSLESVSACSDVTSSHKLCLNFNLIDYTVTNDDGTHKQVTKKLEVFEDKIIYDEFAMSIPTGSKLGNISAVISYISDDTLKYNSFLTIDVPLTNKLTGDTDFGLHVTTQFYTETNDDGIISSDKFKAAIKDKAINEANEITLTTFTVNDLIKRTISKTNLATTDGLYDVSLESWYLSTNKDMPKYVYKGKDPNNYVVLNDKCYRIMQITNDKSLKLIYESDYIDSKCAVSDTSGSLSDTSYGSDNDWTKSTAKNKLSEFSLNDSSKVSSNGNFYYGSVSQSAISKVNDTVDTIWSLVLSNKENAAFSELTGTYGDRTKVALPTVVDYILASRDSDCVGINSTTCKNYNYLYKNYNYWTMTADGESTTNVWYIGNDGVIKSKSVSDTAKIRPVIYLKETAYFNVITNDSTKGSKNNPYIVKQ